MNTVLRESINKDCGPASRGPEGCEKCSFVSGDGS